VEEITHNLQIQRKKIRLRSYYIHKYVFTWKWNSYCYRNLFLTCHIWLLRHTLSSSGRSELI